MNHENFHVYVNGSWVITFSADLVEASAQVFIRDDDELIAAPIQTADGAHSVYRIAEMLLHDEISPEDLIDVRGYGEEGDPRVPYYLVRQEDVSPDADPNHDFYQIQTEPPRTNRSGEIRVEGWCGTTNDRQILALGEFDSVEAAEQALADFTGADGYRDYPGDGSEAADWDYGDEEIGVAGRYWHGEIPYLSRETSGDFAWETIEERINAESTEADIDSLVNELEEACRCEWGAQLHVRAVYRDAEQRREELKEEVAE